MEENYWAAIQKAGKPFFGESPVPPFGNNALLAPPWSLPLLLPWLAATHPLHCCSNTMHCHVLWDHSLLSAGLKIWKSLHPTVLLEQRNCTTLYVKIQVNIFCDRSGQVGAQPLKVTKLHSPSNQLKRSKADDNRQQLTNKPIFLSTKAKLDYWSSSSQYAVCTRAWNNFFSSF